jgi:hypothetical protein
MANNIIESNSVTKMMQRSNREHGEMKNIYANTRNFICIRE